MRKLCVSLFNEEIEHCYIECFISETFGNAILDAGCIKTVCGKVWFNCYLEMLDEKYRISVKSKFRFGDGKINTSIENVLIPAEIGGLKVNIETDVVPSDLPSVQFNFISSLCGPNTEKYRG